MRAGQLRRGVLIIDLVGVAVVSLCALATYSLASAQAHRVSDTIPRLQASLEQSSLDVGRLTSSCRRHRAEIAATQAILERSGLPQSTPVEVYLQAISRLAEQNHIRVVQHHPLNPVAYPALLEQRCSYSVSGRASDLVAFLHAVEQAPYWADISYLSIRSSLDRGAKRAGEHTARLTFSLFAHVPENSDEQEDQR